MWGNEQVGALVTMVRSVCWKTTHAVPQYKCDGIAPVISKKKHKGFGRWRCGRGLAELHAQRCTPDCVSHATAGVWLPCMQLM